MFFLASRCVCVSSPSTLSDIATIQYIQIPSSYSRERDIHVPWLQASSTETTNKTKKKPKRNKAKKGYKEEQETYVHQDKKKGRMETKKGKKNPEDRERLGVHNKAGTTNWTTFFF